MPMFGVMRLTFERDGGSMRGEEDFFSVARTMPFVADEGEDQSMAIDSLNRRLYPPLMPNEVTP